MIVTRAIRTGKMPVPPTAPEVRTIIPYPMPTTSEALSSAAQCYESGRFDDAKRICEVLVATEPSNAGAWYLLALVALQNGDEDGAVRCSERAFELAPAYPQEHC